MTTTKITMSASIIRANTESSVFLVKSSVSLNPRINEKLEQKIEMVLKDLSNLKTIEEYFRGMADTRLVLNEDNFNTINALLCQIEDNTRMLDTRPPKRNVSLLVSSNFHR